MAPHQISSPGDSASNFLKDKTPRPEFSTPNNEALSYQEEIIDQLEAELNTLTLEAQTIISQQTRSTQLKLTVQTRQLFDEYKQFGSMARLKVGLDKFMNRADQKGTVSIVPSEIKTSSEPSQRCNVTENEPPHYGRAFMLNQTSDDDHYVHPSIGYTNSSANATKPNTLYTIDPDSVAYVTTLPWDPLATKIVWPREVVWPKGILSAINKTLTIVDHECRIRLFHHISTYGPSPVFRAGIAAYIRSHYASIFETEEENFVGLTPESRVFLRGVYDKHPNLNSAESQMLALACRVEQDSVDLLWEHLTRERKAYTAMRIFVTAREIEKGRRAQARERRLDEEVAK